MPVKYDENSLIWVAVDQPVKDNRFLSSKILELCGNLPIFWLKPMYPKGKFYILVIGLGILCHHGSWEPLHWPEHGTKTGNLGHLLAGCW